MAAINLNALPIQRRPSWHSWTDWHDLSWHDLYKFKATSLHILSGNIQDPITQQNIQSWRTVANNIDRSFRVTPPFYQGVLDIITLNIFKKFILQIVLPLEILRIDAKVQAIAAHRPSKPTTIHPKAPTIAEQGPPQLTTSLLSENITQTLSILMKAQKYFVKNQVTLVREATVLHPCSNKELTQKVKRYFEEKLMLITEHNVNVCLPRWYHTTQSEETVIKILASSTLQQNHAPFGMGVYFSTEQENGTLYGSNCFALDPSMIHPLPASYYPALSNPTKNIWIRVEQNVPVLWNSVAHIVVQSPADETNLRASLSKLGAISDDTAITLTVPIVDIPTNKVLQACFREAYGQTYFPAHWKKHRSSTTPLAATLPYKEPSA